MKFFLAAFAMQLRRLLRQKGTLACLLALPALVLALGLLMAPSGQENPITVGIWLPEEDSLSLQFWNVLDESSDESLRFVRADSRAQLEGMVAATAWECGYILPDDFEARVAEGRYARFFTRVESASTSMAALADWAVSSALLDVCAPGLVSAHLGSAGILPPGEQPQIADKIQKAFSAETMMQIIVATGGGQPLADAKDGSLTAGTLVRGLVALLMLLFSLLCAVRFAQDMALGFFARVQPYGGAVRLYFASWGAASLLAAFAGLLGLLLAAGFFPAAFSHPLQEAALLLAYLLLLAAFSFCLSGLFPGQSTLVAILPFLLVACLLFCPILFDLSHLFAPAGAIAPLLPPTLYLHAAAGSPAALWQMLVYGVLLALGGLLARGVRARFSALRLS